MRHVRHHLSCSVTPFTSTVRVVAARHPVVPSADVEAVEYKAALDSYEEFNPASATMVVNKSSGDFGVPHDAIEQARSGDIGLSNLVAGAEKELAEQRKRVQVLLHRSRCTPWLRSRRRLSMPQSLGGGDAVAPRDGTLDGVLEASDVTVV